MTQTIEAPGQEIRARTLDELHARWGDARIGQLYIGGEWRPAASGATFEVHDPATGEVVADVADAGATDAVDAVAAAEAAFPEWSSRLGEERGEVLDRLAALIIEHQHELARTITLENGKTVPEALAEITGAIRWVKWYAGEAARIHGEYWGEARRDRRYIVLKQPIGVVGAIAPWNFPFSMPIVKVAPALAAGCTVVLKPAEETPLTSLEIARLAELAGLPAGALNVVTTADPAPVGTAILESPAVRAITFTGSRAVGSELMRAGSERLLRMLLELGGHAPCLVCEDAELDRAIDSVVAAKFMCGGQVCVSINRIYVHRSRHDEFVERLTERVEALTVGDGFDPHTNVGPLIGESALRRMEDFVSDAKGAGAQVETGGKPAATGQAGAFFQPTVLSGCGPGMKVMHEETFGPLAPVVAFDTDDEAIAAANATPYGLSAYLFTRDTARGVRIAERLEAGTIAWNGPLASEPQVPFGGVKESGIGRERGLGHVDEFLETKSLGVVL
jgi:succinate-semialdehyde dehydrogenase/glutarate-semialdehyde dehydrogenase